MRGTFVFLMLPVLIVGALCFTPSMAIAQTSGGRIIGTVTDPSGAVIPGATVTATREQAATIVTQTNEAGRYTFTGLTPGVYTLTVEAPNFKKAVLTDIIVEVGGVVTRDVTLEPGEITEEVVVTASEQPVVEVGKGPSIGDVVDARRVLDLPLNGRNPMDLIQLQAGVVGGNVSGNRTTSNNIRVDGVQAQDNFIQEDISTTFISPSVDDVAEFRVTTSPVDAEYGRGGGAQVDVVTRSGSNDIHGSVFYFHRNTALNANEFFNNRVGQPRETLLRHQFGFRIGGPIIKDRTFYFGLYEGERMSTGDTVTRTVLTEPARRGIFRYFPNFANGNITAGTPTVDSQGNPVPPPGMTLDDLQRLDLFSLDPRRSTPDQSGLMRLLLDGTPLPNDFTIGDGLNTAGFTFFAPVNRVRDRFTIRLDHALNDEHRIFGIYRFDDDAFPGFAAGFQRFPGFGRGEQSARAQSLSLNFISSFTPTLVNEFRYGFQRVPVKFLPPEEGGLAELGGELPTLNGVKILPFPGSFSNPIDTFEQQDRISPVYQFNDTITWIRGDHELRGGVEIRFISARSRDTFGVLPRVSLGEAPASQVQLPSNVSANDAGRARAILYDLTGSIQRVDQFFRTPDGEFMQPFTPEDFNFIHRQLNFFFRDEWRVSSNFTFIYGIRYEYNTVPYEQHGLLVQPTLGPGTTRFEAALGISNRTGTFADLFKPNPEFTDPLEVGPVGFELVGPGRANPLFKDDYNNFAPVIGISWSPRFKVWGLRHLFGSENQSVIRAGYSIGYDAFPLVLFAQFSRLNPGLLTQAFLQPTATEDAVSRLDNPTGITLPIPLDDNRALQPLDFQRSDSGFFIDENLRSPYVQNWNFSIQRELDRNTVLELRYVGTKGTRLVRTTNVNEINIIENGLAREFSLVRQQLLETGDPLGATPRRFPDGVEVLRQVFRTPGRFLNQFGARTDLLLGNFVLIAFNMDRQAIFGAQGGWLARAGLPVNFISANPQFASVLYMSNFSSSTYHAFQVEVRRRFSQGLSFQANYTWSKALGDGVDNGQNQFAFSANFRTNRDRSIEKRRLVFDREHVFKANWIWELPIGPGRRFFNGTHGVVGKLIGGWQFNGIFLAFSGSPRTFSSGRFTLYGAGGLNFVPPDPAPGFRVNDFHGKVTRQPNGVTFLPNVSNPFQDPFNLNRQVVDENGNVLIVTPEPGTPGTLGLGVFNNPGEYSFDASIIKRTAVTEDINVEFRAEFFNVFNNVNFGGPNLNINSPTFGQISTQTNDPRIIQFALRVNF